MSTLRSALDELRGEDLRHASDEELEEGYLELRREVQGFEAEMLRRLGEIERRGSVRLEGYASTAAWLSHRARVSWPAATGEVRTARALPSMPRTREAHAVGDISAQAVRILVDAHRAHTEAFAEAEEVLVDAATSLSVRQLGSAVSYWRQAQDEEGSLRDADEAVARRSLHASRTIFGMVRLDADLDPETGETVLTALRAAEEAAGSTAGEPTTAAQRRADALGEICRQWLDRPDRPTVGGERPHVSVVLDLDALERRAGRTCELDRTGPVHPEAARRIACDASVDRVIMRGASEPLEAGRRTPVVPSAMRRAVVLRDRHCRFPGCDRPHAWCDAHHVVHWADGGRTDVANLVLLCRAHHRMVHRGFRLELVDGRPDFSRPDGTRIPP